MHSNSSWYFYLSRTLRVRTLNCKAKFLIITKNQRLVRTHCYFTRNIAKPFRFLGFPAPSPRFATRCVILNKQQLSLTWLYFLTPQGGCESEPVFLKHFEWKIIAAAYRFACCSFYIWPIIHFYASFLLRVCHHAVSAFTQCFTPRSLPESSGLVHIQAG